MSLFVPFPSCCPCSGVWHGVESRWQVPGHSLQGWQSSHLWPSQVHCTCASMLDTMCSVAQYIHKKRLDLSFSFCVVEMVKQECEYYCANKLKDWSQKKQKTQLLKPKNYFVWWVSCCSNFCWATNKYHETRNIAQKSYLITGNISFPPLFNSLTRTLIAFSFCRMAQVLRATGELVWCGCVMASTCWCQDLTGTGNYDEFSFSHCTEAFLDNRINCPIF